MLVQRPGFQVRTVIKTVGAGLPAKAVCQSMNRVTDPAPSRASPLPHLGCIPRLEPGCAVGETVSAAPRIPSRTTIKTVGAGLPAKAVCQSMNRVTDPAPSRASPLPHSGCIPRLGLGCAVGETVRAAPRIPSRTTIKTVGAGLLAKAVCQSMNRVTDPAPSRASPLPHFWLVFQGWNRVVPSVEMWA
jgi:hypothetical protein